MAMRGNRTTDMIFTPAGMPNEWATGSVERHRCRRTPVTIAAKTFALTGDNTAEMKPKATTGMLRLYAAERSLSLGGSVTGPGVSSRR